MAKKGKEEIKKGGKKFANASKKIENEKVCAVLSYLFIGIIWYFADENVRKSDFTKFHAKQGIILFIADIIYSIVIGIIFTPLTILSLGLLAPLLYLLYYVPLIWIIRGIINATNNRMEPLPLIGKFGEKFTF